MYVCVCVGGGDTDSGPHACFADCTIFTGPMLPTDTRQGAVSPEQAAPESSVSLAGLAFITEAGDGESGC